MIEKTHMIAPNAITKELWDLKFKNVVVTVNHPETIYSKSLIHKIRLEINQIKATRGLQQ